MSDYDRISVAIDYIRSHVDAQPSLADIAAQVHLSEHHFQRLFSRWAGITPKRFLQTLTLDRAKTILRESNIPLLDVTHETGLSSNSRLYDHFVQIDAVTPMEFRLGGQGLTITYGYHETPFGTAVVATTGRGICKLGFEDKTSAGTALDELIRTWPQADLIADNRGTASVVNEIFKKGVKGDKPLSLWVHGTNFQINVWRALLNIAPGTLVTHSDIASAIGKPRAARAVGAAVGANPVALIIPCHRVIQRSGELGGYRWGTTRKHALLMRELAKAEM